MFNFKSVIPWRTPKAKSASYPVKRPYPGTPGLRRRRPIPGPINKFYVPLAVMAATSRAMQQFGLENRECYVWWGGYFTREGEAQVCTALIAYTHTSYGCVELDNEALRKLHERLRELDQVLVCELHSHPPSAGGQNAVDAAHPAATYPGFISIVVPDFAFPLFHDLRRAYVYEYSLGGNWRELAPKEVQSRFVIEETELSVAL